MAVTSDARALLPQRGPAPERLVAHTQTARYAAVLDALITLVVALVVAGPALFTQNGFAVDFTNGLWLGWVQGHAIAHGFSPTYFTNTPGAVFNPVYAFYGGTLFTVVGALGAILQGRAVLAQEVLILAGVLAAQGGFTWLARQCGVRGLIAHVPGVVFVSSAYYITDLYGRGDLPEFMAVSMIPLVLASGANLLRPAPWRPLGVSVFALSVALLTGSHNITLLWGTVALTLAAGILLIVCWPISICRRRVGAVVGVAVLAASVNAWFLLTDVFHAGDVGVSQHQVPWSATSFFNMAAVLFDPLRYVPSRSGTPALYVQIPLWFLAWAIVVLLWIRRRAGAVRPWRVGVGLGATLAVLLVLIMTSPPWDLMPAVMRNIQFAYRLNSYVALAVAGMVLAGVLGLQRLAGRFALGAGWLRGGLAVVVLVSVGLCVWQLWVPEDRMTNPQYPRGWSYTNRHQALISPTVYPRTWYDASSFADASEPIVAVPQSRSLIINPNLVSHDRVSATFVLPPGRQPIVTNVLAGPYLVSIAGVQRLGRTSGGLTVVRRLDSGSGPVHIVIQTASSASVAVGHVLSVFALFGLALLIGFAALGRRTGRGRINR